MESKYYLQKKQAYLKDFIWSRREQLYSPSEVQALGLLMFGLAVAITLHFH
jgi:hypothetical protein